MGDEHWGLHVTNESLNTTLKTNDVFIIQWLTEHNFKNANK